MLNARVLWGEEMLHREVKAAFGCDLLSDMLAYARKVLLLTGLTNEHLINTADIIGACGIVYVRGKMPNKSIINLAAEKEFRSCRRKCFI